jgi:hypothetical protein
MVEELDLGQMGAIKRPVLGPPITPETTGNWCSKATTHASAPQAQHFLTSSTVGQLA